MLARILLLLLIPAISLAASSKAPVEAPKPDWKFVEDQLKKEHFKKAFIEEMKKNYNTEKFEDVLKLNVLLFLRKADYHGPQVTDASAADVQSYIRKYRDILNVAEQKYDVPAEVIVSLLWMESRLGNTKGTFHVPSVYLDLVQAQKKSVIAYLKTQTDKFTSDKVTKKQYAKIASRAKDKSRWALTELKSIQKVYDRKWDIGPNFTGSFAGAFGMPQFIPSSYVLWARAFKDGEQPILSNPEDAITSVAFYLHSHGRWKTGSAKRQVGALMSYNNSKDYANAILDLSKRTTELKSIASENFVKKSNIPEEEIKPEQLKERVRGDSFRP